MTKQIKMSEADSVELRAIDASFAPPVGIPGAARAAHLLIVEDDPGASFVMTAALNFGGFTSEVVTSAVEALRRTGERSYDLILIDLGLPDLDGAQLIKTIQFHSEVPIIIVSGRSGEEDKVAGLDAGADDFVAKPYSPSELLARIRAVLRRAPRLQPEKSDDVVLASKHPPLTAPGENSSAGALSL